MIGVIALVGLMIYFLPSIIASLRRSTKLNGIFISNLLFGWSGLGWLIILIIALL